MSRWHSAPGAVIFVHSATFVPLFFFFGLFVKDGTRTIVFRICFSTFSSHRFSHTFNKLSARPSVSAQQAQYYSECGARLWPEARRSRTKKKAKETVLKLNDLGRTDKCFSGVLRLTADVLV